jgi:hypothetical protein
MPQRLLDENEVNHTKSLTTTCDWCSGYHVSFTDSTWEADKVVGSIPTLHMFLFALFPH